MSAADDSDVEEDAANASQIIYNAEDAVEEHLEEVEAQLEEVMQAPDVPGVANRGRGRGGRGRGRGGHPHPGPLANYAAWANVAIDVDIPPFIGDAGPVLPPEGGAEALSHSVDLFLTPPILNMIRLETNRRAHLELGAAAHDKLLDNWKDVSAGEVSALLSIIITMGLMELPDEDDYWCTDDYWSVPFVSNLMSRKRFKQMKHCLMVANPTVEQNAEDKLAKVRPFLGLVGEISRARYQPYQDCSLDESQCQCGHRHARFAYRGETKKPIADYIKVISLHCSKTGYCYSFFVDTRSESIREMVVAVCAPLPARPYRIATDRFYTGVDTARKLLQRGLYMYGTVRTDRGIDKTIAATVATNGLTDGQFIWSMAPPSLLSCVWRDSTPTGVWFLSTCHKGDVEQGEVRRRKRGYPTAMKPAPQVAIDYNKFMGGCDRANSLRSSYSTYLTHKKRWYMSLFYYGLDVLIVNSFIYRNETAPGNQLTQKKWREEIAKLFAVRAMAAHPRLASPLEGQRTRTPVDQLPAARLFGQHFVERTDVRRQCAWCYKTTKVQRQTVYRCSACRVHLHPDCFAIFHDPQAQI